MGETRSIQFESVAGQPTRVRATSTDGTPYEILVQLTVMEVDEVLGEKAADGAPKFNVGAALSVHARRVET